MTQSFILTVIDTTGIQGYVFGSNRMRENIGASELVEQATQQWPLQLLAESTPLLRHNLETRRQGYDINPSKCIENGGIDVELLYAGGGNTVLLFRTLEHAKAFAASYSKHVLCNAPGLNVVILHHAIEWNNGSKSLHQSWKGVMGKEMGIKKATRPYSVPLPGISVTAVCESTGEPAVSYDPFYLAKVAEKERRPRLISAEIAAKTDRDVHLRSRQRLEHLLPDVSEKGFAFWYDPEQTESEFADAEGRYVAVIHADGNGMGKRFEQIIDHATDDRMVIEQLRSLSEAVKKAGSHALTELGRRITNKRELLEKIQIPATAKNPKIVIPFRPLVYGGDDVTFICDGRIGLWLAAEYLQIFEEESAREFSQLPIPDKQKQAFACAGIAIVKLHYPFARAYDLAEQLCKKAKSFVRAIDQEKQLSALDWHISQSGLFGSVQEIRQREYAETAERSLVMRPVRLWQADGVWRTWDTFASIVKEFRNGKEWKGKQNKVIQLREALRHGEDAVAQYCAQYEIRDGLPPIPTAISNITTQGWADDYVAITDKNVQHVKRCVYFDAIEALDHMVGIV